MARTLVKNPWTHHPSPITLSARNRPWITPSASSVAYSYKHGGTCIAGREITSQGYGPWIRPVSARIAEMSSTTQFVVITRSKRTMAQADVIYGVTMQEPGVSKIVSVNLGQTNRSQQDTNRRVA